MTDPLRTLVVGDHKPVVADAAVDLLVSFPPITMSVDEVEALRRGSVLEIGCRLMEAELSVRVGDQVVASGYLVARVEDHVGVVLRHVGRSP